MRWLLFLLATATLVKAADREGNRVVIPADGGGSAVEFASLESFQFERWSGAAPPRGAPLSSESLAITVIDNPDGSVRLTTRFLDLLLAQGQLTVKTASGREVAVFEPSNAGVLRLKAYSDEMFYGLGATTAPKLNLRGSVIQSPKAFMLSSHGYGLYIPSGLAQFDLTKPDFIEVVASNAKAQFYYGPNPKEILEQYALTTHHQVDLDEATLATRDAKKLPREIKPLDLDDAHYCDSPRILNQLSLSGELFPALDLARLPKRDQLIRLLPFLYDSSGETHPELEQRRSPWELYLIAYLREAHDRGLPIIRPLLMQFPLDKGLDARADLYMIGDEVLVAPGCNVTEIELPRGSWTDLRNNVRNTGRQKIKNDPHAGLPIFAKAGSLIPLVTPRRLELHYFPSLGGEFFVYEPQANDYSQFHAAPSADFMRVESESKVARTCEWVLHHSSKPTSVGETGKSFRPAKTIAELQSGTWFFDAVSGNLHIVIATNAGEDHVINLRF